MGALYSLMSGIGIGLFIVELSHSITGKPLLNRSIFLALILGVSFAWIYQAIEKLRKK